MLSFTPTALEDSWSEPPVDGRPWRTSMPFVFPNSQAATNNIVPSIVIALIALAIFVLDAVTDVGLNYAVLYVAVVLMSARIYERRGVIIVTLGCMVLIVAAHVATLALFGKTAYVNLALAYLAVGVTALLALKEQSVQMSLRKVQAELAHVTRVTTLGELAASIAHEVNQPLSGVVANAEACLRWLDRATPDLDAARRSVGSIINDGNRASEVIRRVRALANKTEIKKEPLDVNSAIDQGVALMKFELISHKVSLRKDLTPALPAVFADPVQLQQVIINLVMNGIEAMQSVTDRPRELVIRSCPDKAGQVQVTIEDCGVGIASENVDKLFNPFFTTKAGGMGMGLSICRSIMEANGGRLGATANLPHGATFQFTLPVNADHAS